MLRKWDGKLKTGQRQMKRKVELVQMRGNVYEIKSWGMKTSPHVSRDCHALGLAHCKKLLWCYTNLPIMILASELVFLSEMFTVLFRIYYLFTLLLLLLFIALDAAVDSFPQRNKYFFFISF